MKILEKENRIVGTFDKQFLMLSRNSEIKDIVFELKPLLELIGIAKREKISEEFLLLEIT